MSAVASELVDCLNLEVIETIDVPAQSEVREALPPDILKGPLSHHLAGLIRGDLVWRHQARALQNLLDGENVVVSTGTGSGKSLIFQLYSFHKMLSDPSAKVLVFYPLKALASDQYARWQAMAEKVGLKTCDVARIDGDIPTTDRGAILDAARVILMTPDVCQAWLMRSVGSSVVRRFLDSLSLLVLDEAHVYESVFGSNVAFLLRRLKTSRDRALRAASPRKLQLLAATATIAEPEAHLRELTGLDFVSIGEELNGAPTHTRLILHVNGPDRQAAAESALVDLLRGIGSLPERHRFIAFVDSRQGTERIVRNLANPDVLPYRSGYEANDRKSIETALRNGNLDGVVSTSALELGIDIADMTIGANVGVPQSRKAFRQRIGRVGRGGPGIFFVIAPPGAFRRFGQTFADYYQGSVEPSYLYLGNRFVQYAHARCLADELEVLGANQSISTGAHWPQGFDQVFRFTRPGGGRPREFDLIAQIGGDSPHHNYPLRQIGEAGFNLNEGRGEFQNRVGNIATNQAIREAYPGAVYLHMGKPFKVLEWSTRTFERAIRLSPSTNPVATRPLLRKSVSFSLAPDGIVGGRLLRSNSGLVAEVHMQVNESVEGYSVGSTNFLYRDLRAENPAMSRKQRDFRTTGIVVQIDEPWFAGPGAERAGVRSQIADGLLSLVTRDKSISPQDVDAAHTNIALLTEAGPQRLTNAVVIYDSVYGGLRLTECLFLEFRRYIELVAKAADLAGSDAMVPPIVAEKLEDWALSLSDGEAEGISTFVPPDGWYQVYKPGSVVSILHQGNFVEREIVAPKLADLLGIGQPSLFYTYATKSGTGFIPHDQVQTTGHEWSWVLWNKDTGEFQELEAGVHESVGVIPSAGEGQ